MNNFTKFLLLGLLSSFLLTQNVTFFQDLFYSIFDAVANILIPNQAISPIVYNILGLFAVVVFLYITFSGEKQ